MDTIILLSEHFSLVIILIVIGSIAGVLAGLMGIGGGIVLVPALYYSMNALGYAPSTLMHMAVGTSLAIMVPTGLSSARAHLKKGSVDKNIFKKIGIGIFFGVILGTVLAHHFSGEGLRSFFALSLLLLAAIMLSNPGRFAFLDDIPKQPFSAFVGIFVGMISTLMGIGGAVMNVPFMSLCKVPIHKAIGTASALGLTISIPGLIGFVVIGFGAESLPPFSIGYINMIAWLIIVPFSVAMAPLGAKLAHSMPVEKLRKVFAILLLVIAVRMLWEVFAS